jgi:hypothetical protein
MRVPLNKFVRVATFVSNVPKSIYITPEKKTSVVINALATNVTNQTQSITVSVSSLLNSNSNIVLLSGFKIPKNDAANIAVGKIVLEYGDNFIVSTPQTSSVNITLSILESLNI